MPELKIEHSLVDGRYEVRERLSRGSYAEIFVATDRLTGGREVVIKALNTSLQGTPDADLERTLVENFQNEAMALDAVRHPNVILRWGHGTAADLKGVPFHYLVLEYMPGGDLLKLCRRRPGNALTLNEALMYFRQVCEALAYAHSKGIIHRDLKPNNFLLDKEDKVVKVADFGVAKFNTGEDSEITRVGADIYAPPEHHPDEYQQFERLTAAADIYSLAKSFYTVICGRPPGQFKCDPISSLPDEIMRKPWGGRLLEVLRRATDDDPRVRPASVTEFWSELAQVATLDDQEPDVSEGEETLVRPRLSVSPGALPQSPLQPDFDHTLASSKSHVQVSTATPVDANVAVQTGDDLAESLPIQARDGRPSKFVIDLKQQAPAAVIEAPPKTAPIERGDRKPEKPQIIDSGRDKSRVGTKVRGRFTENLRRRVFILLIALAFIGSMISIYNYVLRLDTSFGFGQPKEVEITAPGLNVRTGPSPRDAVIGVVAKGSRHKVLSRTGQQWMQIEVSQWDESTPHATGQNRGWVYGTSDYVRILSRQWW